MVERVGYEPGLGEPVRRALFDIRRRVWRMERYGIYTATGTSVASATNTLLALTATVDSWGWLAGTNVTPDVPGVYQVHARIAAAGMTNLVSNRLHVTVMKNAGATSLTHNAVPGATTSDAVVSGLVEMNGAGDYFALDAYHVEGANVTVSGHLHVAYHGPLS